MTENLFTVNILSQFINKINNEIENEMGNVSKRQPDQSTRKQHKATNGSTQRENLTTGAGG